MELIVKGLGRRASGLAFTLVLSLVLSILLSLVLAPVLACSGGKGASKPVVDDARRAPVIPADAAEVVSTEGKGDAQVRVEWKDVPTVARTAPGRTTCGTTQAASVAPTTTWGIPDVFVALDPSPSPSPSPSPKRVVFTDCALTPRVVAATGSILLASASETPVKLVVAKAGALPLGGAVKEERPRELYLPTAGHEVELSLEPGAIYRVFGASGAEAWIVSGDVAVTDSGGAAVVRGVQAGIYAVTAWLPPRAGQPARVARGRVTVTNGALGDVTLDISKQ